MSFILPEVVIRKVIDNGLKALRKDRLAFNDLFSQFTDDELGPDYGQKYIDQIWGWFTTTKIPVIQAWSFNAQVIPCISVHLANETEDESKASFNDYAGNFEDDVETGTSAFTVMLDLGIHANKGGDHVLWIYYILSYILFRNKAATERLGLKLSTFSASDYGKDVEKMGNNVWTRWIRFRATTENFWRGDMLSSVEELNTAFRTGSVPATDIYMSPDVDPSTVDPTVNTGITLSRGNDSEDDF